MYDYRMLKDQNTQDYNGTWQALRERQEKAYGDKEKHEALKREGGKCL